MNNTIKNIVSFSMVLILLVSTLQFSLYKMECLISGNTTLSLTEFDDCDKKPANDCSFSEKCCCFHEVNFNFDYNTDLNLKTFKQDITSNYFLRQNFSLFTPITKLSSFNNYTNLPPPGGTKLLKQVQVFRL